MKAVRSPLAIALVLGIVMLSGCPLSGSGPSAPRFNPRGGEYAEAQWISFENVSGWLYYSMNSDAGLSDFQRLQEESVLVADDTTIRAYVIDDNGLRSALVTEEYVITDDTLAPEITSNGIRQENVDYYRYDVVWDAWQADETTGIEGNPTDDRSDWWDLEFAVYCSNHDDIDTLEQAESNTQLGGAQLVKGWHSANSDGEVGRAEHRASKAGERRYFNVFVRDEQGNSSAYGSVRLESSDALDLYLGYELPVGVDDDAVWINPADGDYYAGLLPGPVNPPAELVDTYAVALHDFNADGYDDLVAAYDNLGTVTHALFTAARNGSFRTPPLVFASGTVRANDIEIVDLNGDGQSEIVFANSGAAVEIYSADGLLNTTLPVTETDRLASGDVNGDGAADIITIDTFDLEGVNVWINDGSGEFTNQAQDSPGTDDVTGPNDVLMSDLDGDGMADAVISRLGAFRVEVYFGTSSGVLEPGPAEVWGIEGTKCLAQVDWNQDGYPDVVMGNDQTVVGDYSHIYLNDQSRSFTGPLVMNTGLSTASMGLAVGDLNGDDWPDIVETYNGNPFQIWINNGGTSVDSGFSDPARFGGESTLAIGRLR